MTAPDLFEIDMNGRRWDIGELTGNVFGDDDFQGYVLEIELKDAAEARELAAQLRGAGIGPNEAEQPQ